MGIGIVFSLLGSIFLAIVAAFVAAIAIRTTASGDNVGDGFIAGFGNHGWGGLWLSVAVGVFLGVINYVSPLMSAGLAWLPLVLMLAFSIGLCLFWHKEEWGGVDRLREAVPCVILALLVLLVTSTVAARAAGVAPVGSFGYKFIMILPWVAFVLTIGYFVVDRLYDQYGETRQGGFRTAARVVSGLALVAALTAILTPALGSGLNSNVQTATAEEITEAAIVLEVSEEDINGLTADYSGYPDVFSENSCASTDEARLEATGFSDALTFPFEAKDDNGKRHELYGEIFTNPIALHAYLSSMVDKKIGDQTIGDLNPWMRDYIRLTDEHGISYWCEYRDGTSTIYLNNKYRFYAVGTCIFLDRLVPQGVHAWQTTENWCLNCASFNNDRRGIEASYQYKEDALILAYVGKDQALSGDGVEPGTGLFVIGFNIHDKRPEFYGGTPEAPNPGGPGTPSNPRNPDNPDNPDKPEPKKDPSQLTGTNTERNDNTGPGANTNNPSDPNHSSADRPDNSTSYGSYDEYREAINNLENTNAHQNTGGGSNNPTTTTPSGTTIDNNGANGTGHGGADNPTPTSDPAKEAGSGETINSSPGEAWGGPAD